VLKKQNEKNGGKWNLRFSRPFFRDRYDLITAAGDYFHQDMLVARRIFVRQPIKHIDVGSRMDGFVAHIAVFRPIEVLDIRAIESTIPNITFRQCDLMSLPTDLVEYCDSLSCLHAFEHFGLGRYGDPLDINGYSKGFDSLYKILKTNGILYLSVPIGRERIDFNAHRVFAISPGLKLAKGRLELKSFSYVDDDGDLHENIGLVDVDLGNNFNLHYGCGIFEFRKI